MIQVVCVCGKTLTYLPEFAGKRVRCTKCGKPVQVPAGEGKRAARACGAHPEHRAAGSCSQCGAPICSDCRSLFGYYCSEGCKATTAQAREEAGPAPAPPAPDRSVAIAKAFKWSLAGAAILLVAAGAYWLVRVLTDRGGEVAWTVELDGKFASDLFVEGDSLVLVCGGTVAHHDPDTGRKRAEFRLDGEGARVIARDGGTLLVSDSRGLRAARLADGAELWRLEGRRLLEASVDRGRFCSLGDGGAVSCHDLRTGTKLWQRDFKEDNWVATVLARSGRVIVEVADDVALLDAGTGEVRWTAPGGRLVELTDAGVLCSSRGLRMLSYADGSPLWELPLPEKKAYVEPRTKVAGGRLFVHVDSMLACLDLATGAVSWRAAAPRLLSSLEIGEGAGFVAGFGSEDLKSKLADPLLPVAGKDILRDVVLPELGSMEVLKPFLYCFDPATGRVRWQKMNVGSSCRPEGGGLLVWGTLSAANLLDPTKRFVAREAVRLLSPEDGAVRWEFETDSIATPLVVHGKRLFYARSQSGGNVAGASEPVEPRAVESQLIAIHME